MSFVCLAVTMVLFISLFLYFRQKIIALEEKLALLSEVTTTMAGITTLQRPTMTQESVKMAADVSDASNSSDEEGEEVSYSSSEDDDSVSIEELYETPVMTFVKMGSDIKNVIVMNESTPKLDSFVENFIARNTTGFYPIEVLSDPVEVLSEPVEVLSEPVEVLSDPIEVLSEPVEVLSEPVEVLSESPLSAEDVDAGLPKRVVSTDTVKTLTLDSPYDAMSLKELKEKVAETNGPKLKTKKELIDYLKNKM